MTSRVSNAEETKLTRNENIYYSSNAIAGQAIRARAGDICEGCRLFDAGCGKTPLYWIKGDVPEASSLRARTPIRLTEIGILHLEMNSMATLETGQIH
jgi:hypothetical protein